MDDRQRQIKEGAGLEESRLNVEFIEWLRTWGPRFLTIALIALVAYVGWIQYHRYHKGNTNKSFADYEALVTDPQVTPEALLEFAQGHSNTPGLVASARLMAADLFMNAVRTGVEPGSSPTPDGSYLETDLLTQARRDELLGKATAAFEQTLSQTSGKPGMELQAINALFGLAAVAETRADWKTAESRLNEAKAACEATRFDALAVVAAGRIARLPELQNPPRLYAQSELPKPPAPPEPVPVPEGPVPAPGDAPGADGTPPVETPPSAPGTNPPGAGEPGSSNPAPAGPAPSEPSPTEPAPSEPPATGQGEPPAGAPTSPPPGR